MSKTWDINLGWSSKANLIELKVPDKPLDIVIAITWVYPLSSKEVNMFSKSSALGREVLGTSFSKLL